MQFQSKEALLFNWRIQGKKHVENNGSIKKKARISLDISSHINDTTSNHIVRKVKSTSRFCVGIADSTDEKNKLYIAESLRMNATFYDTGASLKIHGLLPQNDLIKKMEIISSIFTEIGIKTIE